MEESGFLRTDTSINILPEFQEMFEEGIKEFKCTYKKINEYLSKNPDAAKYHTVQLGLYEGNNTVYMLTADDGGISYDKIEDDNLLSICKIVLSVASAVEMYHDAGFLHLDIKPKNIMILCGITEIVKLFDFDSLISVERIKNRDLYGLKLPEDYYVPELYSASLLNIGFSTDIFEIGAMLFLRLFKRPPKESEILYDSEYDLDDLELLKGVSAQVKNEFIELFKKTLQTAICLRYKTIGQLKQQLKKIISLLSIDENLNSIKPEEKNSISIAEYMVKAAWTMSGFGDYDSNQKFARKAIEICEQYNHTHDYVYLDANIALADVLLIQGKTEEALARVNKIDFNTYSDNKTFDIVKNAGLLLCQLSKFDEIGPMCLDLLSKEDADNSEKFYADVVLSLIQEQKGNFKDAEVYAQEAEKCLSFMESDSVREEWLVQHYRSYARIKFRIGNYEQAITIISKPIETFDKTRTDNYLLGVLCFERGLYYLTNGQTAEFESDNIVFEQILKKTDGCEESYITLYNGIAAYFESASDRATANKYLKKIVESNPRIRQPKTYREAVFCNNIGRNEMSFGELEEAETFFKNAAATFERLGINKGQDYFDSKINLAAIAVAKKDYKTALKEYMEIRNKYDVSCDKFGEFALGSSIGIITSLFNLNKNSSDAVYDFAINDIRNFETWFGELSPIRIEAILKIGGAFKDYGYRECLDFFLLADRLILKSKDFESLNYAKLLNSFGVYETKFEKNYPLAKLYFQRSKKLFEQLNAKDNEYYAYVLESIKYLNNVSGSSEIINV
ncbi:MAG: hypothetical protein ACI4W6_07590 [Acutalibacteraceae bacterium]